MKHFSPFPFPLSKGFTMIELLVAIGILGIMATTLLAVIDPFAQFKKANDAKRKGDLHKISTLLEEYYNDHNKYPQAGLCTYGSDCYVYSTSGTSWIPALVTDYAKKLPVDPINNSNQPWTDGNYSYAYGNVSSDGQHYDLLSQLEYKSDPQRCGLQDYMYVGAHWCTAFGGSYSNQVYAISK